MTASIEVRERHKALLGALLRIKKINRGKVVDGLQQEIDNALMVTEQEDVAWVEKIAGVTAQEG